MKGTGSMGAAHIRISTPGRVCLFGEHQDYLCLPVVPCAISLRIEIEGVVREGVTARIALPDIGTVESIPLGNPLSYRSKRDYFRSAVNVLLKRGYTFSKGCDCTVRGKIPINSGTSSSSALIVSWIAFLALCSDQRRMLAPLDAARIAHEAEVLEFHEPGGMMDHYSTACGGVLAIDFYPAIEVHPIPVELGSFVLGDSMEPKETTAILGRVKQGVLQIVERLRDRNPGFTIQTAEASMVEEVGKNLSRDEKELLLGTIRNRNITREARALLSSPSLDHRALGGLLNDHQEMLRDVQKISTPKIDRMIAAALAAGAYGGKLNGSGGGGCMFAYAPEGAGEVAKAIEREGGRAYVVSVAEGMKSDLVE